MAAFPVNPVVPYNQYTASASQTVFTFNFQVLDPSWPAVYHTPSGEQGVDSRDILEYNVDYLVSLNQNGTGFITLINPASVGDLITIVDAAPLERQSIYANVAFNTSYLDADFNQLVLYQQQINMIASYLTPHYQNSFQIPPNMLSLPLLGQSQQWISSADGTTLLAAPIVTNDMGANQLRAELLSTSQPGASIVGTNDGFTTVQASLNDLRAQVQTELAPGFQYQSYVALNAGVPLREIDFGTGTVRDSTDAAWIKINSTITKSLSSAWVAGSGNGGLLPGVTLAANTTYYLFVISTATGTVDAGFGTSFTPTLPTGYIYYRRRGYIMTDGSSNIIPFYQSGSEFYYKTLDTTYRQTPNCSTTPTLYNFGFPIAESLKGSVSIRADQGNGLGTTPVSVAVLSPQITNYTPAHDTYVSSDAYIPAGGGVVASRSVVVALTNSSGQLNVICSINNGVFDAVPVSWNDPRLT